MNKELEHPICLALKMKKKAIKLKAHPKIIENIEKQIQNYAKISAPKIECLIDMGLLPDEKTTE